MMMMLHNKTNNANVCTHICHILNSRIYAENIKLLWLNQQSLDTTHKTSMLKYNIFSTKKI